MPSSQNQINSVSAMTSQLTQAQSDEALTHNASSPLMFSQITHNVVENEQMAPQVVSPTQ
jgi:hypothetical protein